MSDETRAAAALLYKATMNTLRRCRANSNVVRSAEDLAHCATPQLVDVVMSNDSSCTLWRSIMRCRLLLICRRLL